MHFPIDLLVPIFLYAETHYKFKGVYSRLIKKEPEIVADAPFRVDSGKEIPVLILFKDSHRYPVEFLKLEIELKAGKQVSVSHFEFKNKIIDRKFYSQIFYVKPPFSYIGMVALNVAIHIKVGSQVRRYFNDNYRISSHEPLRVYVSEKPLPRLKNLYFGDIHWHSKFTEDMVEFGAPIESAIPMAKALGLDFFAVTDHSYDLDDDPDDWLKNDPAVPKWNAMKNEVADLNHSDGEIVILPGEEVSAGNSRDRNVHLLVINSEKFFPGKGDGAEKWLRTRPDMSIPEILEGLAPESLAIAAHPEMSFPFLQRLFLRRGSWETEDFQHPRLIGYQIWNGEEDDSFFLGSDIWRELLLSGKRLALFAGNDAHGNFNRFRQIGFPFLTFLESDNQIFGKMRTGVLVTQVFNYQNLVRAMQQGRTIVTNGPVAALAVENERGDSAEIGDEIGGKQLTVSLRAVSSAEFGKFAEIKIILGDLKQKREIEIFNLSPENKIFEFENSIQIESAPIGYVRAEVTTQDEENKIYRCLTSPVYLVGGE